MYDASPSPWLQWIQAHPVTQLASKSHSPPPPYPAPFDPQSDVGSKLENLFYNPSSRSTKFRIDGDTISGTNAQRNFTPFPKWSKEEKRHR
jgi:hypothetical protein